VTRRHSVVLLNPLFNNNLRLAHQVHPLRGMRCLCLVLLATGAAFAQPAGTNINSRYTVESIEITGIARHKLSKSLLQSTQELIGQHFSEQAVEDLIQGIRDELHPRAVSVKLARGEKPEHVKVTIEVKSRETRFDVSLPKLLYDSRQGASAAVEGSLNVSPNSKLTFGVLSDGDELLERYTGLTARYENKNFESERVRLRFQFESYHQKWNGTTLAALERSPGVPGIYRSRYNFEPLIAFVIARTVTASAGLSCQLFQTQYPAARTQPANAAIAGLRYHQEFEDSSARSHSVDASYMLRAATAWFGSDFDYARHRWSAGYEIASGRHAVAFHLTAGVLTGRAPLLERFVLGNSATLRGWNKFDVAPLGGDRMVHNSVEYRFHDFVAGFYDTGADWNRGQRAAARHSVGVALRPTGDFFAEVAFPIKSGPAEPIFMLGTNF
jgi:hypothetical protein